MRRLGIRSPRAIGTRQPPGSAGLRVDAPEGAPVTARVRHAKLHLLTVREVQTAGEGDHSDGGGLLLRVRDSSDSWVLRYTSPCGRRREMGLGAAQRSNSAMTGDSLTTARRQAHEARQQLQQGVDPIDKRGERRAAAKQADIAAKVQKTRETLTLARAARDYHERIVEPRLTGKHAAQWIASLENHVPAEIWHKPIAQIDAPELLAALASVRSMELEGERVPETLRRIRQRLDAVWEDAIFHKHCTSNPAAAVRRKMRETLPVKQAGAFKALDYRDVPAFMRQLRDAEGVSARCLEFALLTAARTGEVLGATWSEIDLEASVWKIPAGRMKAGEDHVVHLSNHSRELVAGQLGRDQVLLFPSIMKPGHAMSNMALLTTLDRLGRRQETTAHGLCRATFSTWAYETAAARPDVIEACLAHKEADRVKAAYNRAQFTGERRALMDAWAEYLEGKRSATVIPLRTA
jgi:integrase